MNGRSYKSWNYFGFEPAQYHSCMEQISSENRSSSHVINHILLAMTAIYAILSFLHIIDCSNFLPYVFCVIYSLFVELLFITPTHKERNNAHTASIDIRFACLGLMFFGIAISIADPNHTAMVFFAMQVLTAVFLNCPFWQLIIIEIAYTLIFAFSSHLFKDPSIASADLLNACAFFPVPIPFAYFIHREKIKNCLQSNYYHMMSRVDSLTGILNHQYFFEEAGRILKENNGEDLLFVIFDIDHFKDINDQVGHPAGDACIRSVTSNIQWSLLHTSPESCDDLIKVLFPEGIQAHIDNPWFSCENYYDQGGGRFEKARALTGRLGGDEFAALIGGSNPVNRIVQIENAIRMIAIPGCDCITCSIGGAWVSNTDSVESAYLRADKALYEAKMNGRNRIIITDFS